MRSGWGGALARLRSNPADPSLVPPEPVELPARRFLAIAPWPRALGETALVAALSVAISAVAQGRLRDLALLAPSNVDATSFWLTVMLLIGPAGSALWLALRLRLPAGRRWYSALPGEALVGALLAVIPSTILLYLISRYIESAPGRTRAYYIVWGVISAIFVIAFAVYRTGVRLWFWWDAQRRSRLQWALTHALLTVAFTVAALVGVGVFTGIVLLTSPGTLLFQWITALIFLSALIIIAMSLALPPVALFSYFFARSASRRVLSLVRATSQLRAGDLSVRLKVDGADEVAQLQRNFNDMAANLEANVRALRTERDEVARLLQQRRELVASVSHELRTPVATLRGYLDSATMRWEQEDQGNDLGSGADATRDLRHDLEVMRHETERLQGLIDDLFTLARAEVGRLELSMETVDLGAVARQAVETVAPLAWRASRVEVVARVTPQTPLAWGDPARVEQALHNLLRNAMRHTPPGGIIAVVVEPASGAGEDGAGWVALRVRDTGEGIAAEDAPHIFERFYRSDRARALDGAAANNANNGNGGNGGNGSAGGAGLGLALVKEVVEAMGGAVTMESAPGQGSAFSLLLPLAAWIG